MLRAEYEGISYSKMIVPDTPLDNVVVEVYSIAKGETLNPQMTALLFEPGDDRLVINQFFQFSNESDPPRTYSDPDNGTLRFELPPAADGKVQVSTTGPAGMPLRSSARKTAESNVYMVDYPLKTGRQPDRADLLLSVRKRLNRISAGCFTRTLKRDLSFPRA